MLWFSPHSSKDTKKKIPTTACLPCCHLAKRGGIQCCTTRLRSGLFPRAISLLFFVSAIHLQNLNLSLTSTLCYMLTIKSYISLQHPARSLLLLILSLFLLILTQVFSVRLLLVTGYIFHSSFNSSGRRLMAPPQRKSRVHDPSCVTGFHWFFSPLSHLYTRWRVWTKTFLIK